MQFLFDEEIEKENTPFLYPSETISITQWNPERIVFSKKEANKMKKQGINLEEIKDEKGNILFCYVYKPKHVIFNKENAKKLEKQGMKISKIKDENGKFLFYYCYE